MYKIKKIKDVLPRPKNQNLQKLTPFPPKNPQAQKTPHASPQKIPQIKTKKLPSCPSSPKKNDRFKIDRYFL